MTDFPGVQTVYPDYTHLGIPILDPFSQSWDSGISNPGIPAGLWGPSGI